MRIVFRADGGAGIGWGHIIRCIAFAEMLKPSYEIIFITQNPDAGIAAAIKSAGFDCIPLENTDKENLDAAELPVFLEMLQNNDIVVLDGYHFSEDYQKGIINSGRKLIYIDDIHDRHYFAHVVINYAPGINPDNIKAESYTKKLCGPQYVLMREMFLNAAKESYSKEDLGKAFICMGGSDKNNFTQKALEQALSISLAKSYDIVVGSSYKFLPELQEAAGKATVSVNIHVNITQENVLQLMKNCDIAVCSGGTVAIEYSCTGGQLYLIKIADNQSNIYNYFVDNGLAIAFPPQMDTENKIDINLQKHIFDGKSAERLLEEVNILANA